MEIRGEVHEIGATQQVTESFKKRDLIVAYAENPQFVSTFVLKRHRIALVYLIT